VQADYLRPNLLADGVIESTYGDPFLADDTGDSLENVAALDLDALYLQSDETMLSLALSIAGDIFSNRGELSHLHGYDA